MESWKHKWEIIGPFELDMLDYINNISSKQGPIKQIANYQHESRISSNL